MVINNEDVKAIVAEEAIADADIVDGTHGLGRNILMRKLFTEQIVYRGNIRVQKYTTAEIQFRTNSLPRNCLLKKYTTKEILY